jgi:hypothetical protein
VSIIHVGLGGNDWPPSFFRSMSGIPDADRQTEEGQSIAVED